MAIPIHLLGCPICRGALSAVDPTRLQCQRCDVAYPVRDGVPILVRPERQDQIHRHLEVYPAGRDTGESFAARLRRALRPPSPKLNTASGRNLERLGGLLRTLDESATFLNLGSGRAGTAPLRQLDDGLRQRFLNLDVYPFRDVSIVGDAHELPFRDGTLHGVYSSGVFQYLREPGRVAAEIGRITAEGAIVYIEAPFLQGSMDSDLDGYRFTCGGLERLMSDGFETLDSGANGGPASTLAWVLRDALRGLSDRPALSRALLFAGGWLTFWIKYLDLLFVGKKNMLLAASGVYWMGRKRAASRTDERSS